MQITHISHILSHTFHADNISVDDLSDQDNNSLISCSSYQHSSQTDDITAATDDVTQPTDDVTGVSRDVTELPGNFNASDRDLSPVDLKDDNETGLNQGVVFKNHPITY